MTCGCTRMGVDADQKQNVDILIIFFIYFPSAIVFSFTLCYHKEAYILLKERENTWKF